MGKININQLKDKKETIATYVGRFDSDTLSNLKLANLAEIELSNAELLGIEIPEGKQLELVCQIAARIVDAKKPIDPMIKLVKKQIKKDKVLGV